MFSRLDAIFRSNFLPLKEGDTYPGKKREDDAGGDRYQPPQHKQAGSEHSDFDNDRMVVSVAALLAFLNELTQAPDIKQDFSGRNKEKASVKTIPKKANEETERAINAYRHTAEANNPPLPRKIDARIDRMLFHFTAEEKVLLTDLVKELETLHKKGLSHIEINSTNNFFAGLVDAVTAAKAS